MFVKIPENYTMPKDIAKGKLTIVIIRDEEFQLDVVTAVAILYLWDRHSVEVIHTYDKTALSSNYSNSIVIDVSSNEGNQHQKNENGINHNGVPYSDVGLIWHAFGRAVIRDFVHFIDFSKIDLSVEQIDNLVETVFRIIDNGFINYVGANSSSSDLRGNSEVSIAAVISRFNPPQNNKLLGEHYMNELESFSFSVNTIRFYLNRLITQEICSFLDKEEAKTTICATEGK